jgi:hypothetical protein
MKEENDVERVRHATSDLVIPALKIETLWEGINR